MKRAPSTTRGRDSMEHSERFLTLVESIRPHVSEITPEETLTKLERRDAVLLLDTREDHEWERGRIAGAIHLSKGLVERDIEKLAPDAEQEIILYCGGGFRSVLSAQSLKQMGYSNVKSMSSGWRGWLERGYPVEGFVDENDSPSDAGSTRPGGVSDGHS